VNELGLIKGLPFLINLLPFPNQPTSSHCQPSSNYYQPSSHYRWLPTRCTPYAIRPTALRLSTPASRYVGGISIYLFIYLSIYLYLSIYIYLSMFISISTFLPVNITRVVGGQTYYIYIYMHIYIFISYSTPTPNQLVTRTAVVRLSLNRAFVNEGLA
jgi:hypothetical protein